MKHIDQKDLVSLKKLCRIETTEEEDLELSQNLNQVLEYIDLLSEVDTSETAPCNYVLRGMQRNLMRDDDVKNLLTREKFLSNAPDQIGGMIRVPPIMKTDEL